jgi:hypothetical protein
VYIKQRQEKDTGKVPEGPPVNKKEEISEETDIPPPLIPILEQPIEVPQSNNNPAWKPIANPAPVAIEANNNNSVPSLEAERTEQWGNASNTAPYATIIPVKYIQEALGNPFIVNFPYKEFVPRYVPMPAPFVEVKALF